MWRRWGMLVVYMGISIGNGMVWCTYSPISAHTIEYYDTSLDFINWFEMSFFVGYFPPALFVSYRSGILDHGKTPSLGYAGEYSDDLLRMLD